VWPILELASPVWAALPACLVQLVEGVQKAALIESYSQIAPMSRALVNCGLPTLLMRGAGVLYLISSFLAHLLPQPTNVAHGYGLRLCFSCSELCIVRTDHLSNFVTYSYNRA